MKKKTNFYLFLILQRYGEKQLIPRKMLDSSQTCVDKHLIFGQNGENYSKLVQKTKKNLEYSDFILIFAP